MISKYIIGLVIGYITSVISSMPITVLRFGIPMCNQYLKEMIIIPDKEKTEQDLLGIIGLKELKKMYKISLCIWIPIIIIITIICLKWIDSIFIGYIIGILLQIPALIQNTGYNQNNMQDFNNSLERNISKFI